MKRKPRVIYIAETATDGSCRGMFRPMELAVQLVREGWDVTLLAATASNQWPGQIKGGASRFESVKFVRLRTPFSQPTGIHRAANMFVFAMRVGVFLLTRRDMSKPTVIVTASTGFLDIFPAFLARLVGGYRWVFEVRDVWPDSPRQLNPEMRTYGLLWLASSALALAFRSADAVMSTLPGADKLLEERGRRKKLELLHVPNCARKNTAMKLSHSVEPSSSEAARQLGELKNHYRYVVGYFGSFNSGNGTRRLLTLAQEPRLSTTGFLFLGEGVDADAVRTSAASFPNVRVAPPVDPSTCAWLMRHTDVLLIGLPWIPALRYGLSPIKYADYLGAGRPVFSWGASLGADEEAYGHLISVSHLAQVEEAAEKMLDMLVRGRLHLEEMGEKSLERSNSVYNYDYHRARISSFFLRQIHSQARPGGTSMAGTDEFPTSTLDQSPLTPGP